MGDVADDIMDGASCALCGQYFEEEHGYPVVCRECWEPSCGYQKTTINTL